MRRSILESRLEEYVAGDADAATRAELEALLARDPKARALLDEIQRAHDALTSLRDRPEPPVPAGDALSNIQRAIAAQVFAGKPRLELQSSSTRFYRRLAVAAVLLCGISLGLFLHGKLTGDTVAPNAITASGESGSSDESAEGPSQDEREFNIRGEISALEWLTASKGVIDTRTPTDSVIPLFENLASENLASENLASENLADETEEPR
ncbi:MAG: hypothetical protein ACYTGZ_02420 [Planctomycetota bacterium]|jgi:hypothetical protein